jgi:hypothetical protein
LITDGGLSGLVARFVRHTRNLGDYLIVAMQVLNAARESARTGESVRLKKLGEKVLGKGQSN